MPKHTERDPLLAARNDIGTRKPPTNEPLGPLEISKSTRYGILAGIWMSTFLSVSLSFYSYVQTKHWTTHCQVCEQWVEHPLSTRCHSNWPNFIVIVTLVATCSFKLVLISQCDVLMRHVYSATFYIFRLSQIKSSKLVGNIVSGVIFSQTRTHILKIWSYLLAICTFTPL